MTAATPDDGDLKMMPASPTTDDDVEASDTAATAAIKQPSFTPLQHRRLPQGPAVSCVSLCPTMDLVAFGTCPRPHHHHSHHHFHHSPSGKGGSSQLGGGRGGVPTVDEDDGSTPLLVSTSVSVHRTVSWQKLLTLQRSDLASSSASTGGSELFPHDDVDDDDDMGGEDGEKSGNGGTATEDEAPQGATSLCWSPDGRCVAVGLADGGVLVCDVEATSSSSSASEGGGGGDGMGGGDGGGGAVRVLRPPPPVPSLWSETVEEEEEELRAASDDDDCGEEKGSPGSPAPFTPRVTRSMTAARRRRMLRMQGQTPSEQHATTVAAVEAEEASVNATAGKSKVLKKKEKKTKASSWRDGAVIGLTWSRVSPPHPQWIPTDAEREEEASWIYRSKYLDRGRSILPPGAYDPEGGEDGSWWWAGVNDDQATVSGGGGPYSGGADELDGEDEEGAGEGTVGGARRRLTPRAPLSILCVTTRCNGVHLYLHGRYRVLGLPSPSPGGGRVSVSCSRDLGTLLLLGNGGGTSTTAVVYRIPPLVRDRYDLQALSALHSSVARHLRSIREGMRSAMGAWTAALRPLDGQFDKLHALLRDYGVVPSTADGNVKADGIRRQLLQYILDGHGRSSSDAANALDQYFTGPTMHDQLFQRTARGVEAGAAGVESAIRRRALGPAKALAYDAAEVYGLARAAEVGGPPGGWNEDDGDEGSGERLVDSEAAFALRRSSELLVITVERCLALVVEARHRIRTLLTWIRGTAAQVRARGTAVDSVQRENARKRRVPEAVARRVAGFLSTEKKRDGESGPASSPQTVQRSLTECVLGVPLSNFFVENKSPSLGKKEGNSFFQPLPLLASIDLADPSGRFQNPLETPTNTSHLAHKLFDLPRAAFERAVQQIDICCAPSTPEQGQDDIITEETSIFPMPAVHVRIGLDPDGDAKLEGRKAGCFAPLVVSDNGESFHARGRHWLLLARAIGSSKNGIQIVAIPAEARALELGESKELAPSGGGSGQNSWAPPFYLSGFVMLPDSCSVSEISFYGDDGNSSLSASLGRDGTVEEGRQSLGLIVENHISARVSENSDNRQVSEELWIYSYDEIQFRQIQQKTADAKTHDLKILGDRGIRDPFAVLSLEDLDGDAEDSATGTATISPKRRQLRTFYGASIGASSAFTDNDERMTSLTSRLILSGSRGIGGVVSYAMTTTLDLFDLEENEEDDEEEEGVYVDEDE